MNYSHDIYYQVFAYYYILYYQDCQMHQGLVVLLPNSTINMSIFKINDWMPTLLHDQEWDVGQGRFQVLDRLKLFENMKALNVKQLKIRWMLEPTILRSIQKISFPFLKELFLNGNNLASIQPIARISIPNLQNLNLKQNVIMRIGSLRRCQMTNLKQISLYKNKINDQSSLSQLNAPQLQKIWFNGKLQQGNIIGSIGWVAKLETRKLKSFIIHHNHRIEQASAIEAINKKSAQKIVYEYEMQDDRQLNWL